MLPIRICGMRLSETLGASRNATADKSSVAKCAATGGPTLLRLLRVSENRSRARLSGTAICGLDRFRDSCTD